MCGICGIFDLDGRPISRGLLDEMTDSIRHRGPDGDGRFVDGEVGWDTAA
jgi:asparagine synthase (glutamine-hydrolysing)